MPQGDEGKKLWILNAKMAKKLPEAKYTVALYNINVLLESFVHKVIIFCTTLLYYIPEHEYEI